VKVLNEHLIYNILRIISRNGDIINIVSQGYLFSQVMSFLDELRENGYVEFYDNILTVTNKGYLLMRNYEKINEVHNDSKWILRQESFWKEPIDKFQVYIP
jgi:predicted transcriptional regulator